jgi:methionyl aminopeptidase
VICHGIPDARPLEDGDIVNIDVTVYYQGVHSDLNETHTVGEVDEKYKKLIKCSHDSLMKAIEIAKPGTFFRDFGGVISKFAKAEGYSVVKSYCGHGIGTLFHSAPNVPHYAKNKAIGILKPGMCFTIEPMINEGTWKDTTWPDDWTSVTVDGKRSAQFEHTLLVTETGCEILTARTSESPKLPWEIAEV